MLIIIGNQELLKDFPFATTPLEHFSSISEYGLSDNWYGGNAKYIGRVRGSEIFIIVSKDHKTLDTAVDSEDLPGVNYKYLKDIAKKLNIKIEGRIPKEDLIDKIKEKLSA